jgi:peptidoglycan/xylan/chitin deacetylase (PgdA/CDA1 family)
MLNSDSSGGELTTIRIPVLMYHQIEPVQDSGTVKRGIVVDAGVFRKQMRWLRAFGYSAITLDDLGLMLEGRAKPPRKGVVITFDDAYRGVHEYALPILRQYGLTATVFCIAEDLDQGKGERGARAFGTLNKLQARELIESGFSIGSHSYSHRNLVGLLPADARMEVRRSKDVLEAVLGTQVTSLAYPFGSYDPALEKIVEEEGYAAAVTTEFGKEHSTGERFRLKRIPIGFDQGMVGFVTRLAGFSNL